MLADHLGTPLALVNANGEQRGKVAWVARYTAWGQVEEEYNPNQIHQPIRFQGQQLDPETKLHYNRFRYYHPGVGQYITQDPIGLYGGGNLYEYGLNQPQSASDPTGLLAPLAIFGYMAIAGAFSGGAANVVKQTLIEDKCLKDVDLMSVANSTVWGGRRCYAVTGDDGGGGDGSWRCNRRRAIHYWSSIGRKSAHFD